METVCSRDGTVIAFDRQGAGPPLVLVDGACCRRTFGPMPKLAPLLARHFTVLHYDRRGRGESGDTDPYSVEREIEDLDAVIGAAGGSAFVYGISSGAALALEAANRGLAIEKLALYEAPFIVDDSRPPIPDDYRSRLVQMIASDRRGEAVKLFLQAVGMPSALVMLMRLTPSWSQLKAVAHTIVYDTMIVEDHQKGKPLPVHRWGDVTAPTLMMVGEKSPAWMHHAMYALADVVPTSQRYTLAGANHMVDAKALAPVLVDFFKN